MRLRVFVEAAFSVMVGVAAAGAQSGVTGTMEAPHVVVETGAVGGGVVGGIGGFAGSFGQQRGQPYSLVAKTTTVRVLADGTTITNVREERRMRDSEGRTRTEMSLQVGGVPRSEIVNIFDPVAGTMTMLSAQNKQAHVTHMPEMKPPTPEQEAKMKEMRAKAEAARAAAGTQTAGVTAVAGGAQAVGGTAAGGTAARRKAPEVEALTPRNIAGLYAEGKRTVRVIPAGTEGNDRDIRVVTETWMSRDLGVELEHTQDDPRNGKSVMVVTELQRSEPAAAEFQVPEGYKVVEQRPEMGVLQ
jgi:hypothetical protein